jgi:hypothetical protein
MNTRTFYVSRVVHRDHVRVGQLGECTRFLDERRHVVVARQQQLDRDAPVELRIVREVDDAHAAATGDACDDVAADRRSRRQVGQRARRAVRGAFNRSVGSSRRPMSRQYISAVLRGTCRWL